MVGALWTGISGLSGQQHALDNESNNIANVNTIGFKASRISFADQMYQNKIGKGAQVLDAEKLYTQGNLKLTGVSYDMALAGDGFFAVSNTRGGGTSETYYTRAGNFRMGDSGTLQDTVGNEVQGWAVGTEPEVVTSNPNIDIFTSDYTKLLSSKIISYTSAIETITAKATDFTLTAESDNVDIFSGAGLKTKYGKIADVEELIKAYTKTLQALKDDPNSSSAKSTAQISHVNLPDQGSTDAVSQDGDEVYVYIDGNKISQSYLSGTDSADGYRKTMKAFADKISEVPGLKAYVSMDDASKTPSTANSDVDEGIIRIESLIPGEPFTISSTGMVHSGNDKPGTFNIDVTSDPGKGLGALESARDALNEAITGKQTDVYTISDLDNPDGLKDYTYSLTIYDKGLEKNVTIPNDGGTPTPTVTPISIDNVTAVGATTGTDAINDFVAAINADTQLSKYVKAENINDNLVIRTLDTNFDVEMSGDLKGRASEVHTIQLTGPATADDVEFAGYPILGSVSGDTAAQTVARIVADKTNIIADWNTNNATLEIEDISGTGDTLTITYKNTEGTAGNITSTDVDALLVDSNGIAFGAAATVTQGGTTTNDLKRNADYSNREGTGAEFLEIKTRIDQTASKGGLQLRLDTLGISDSAFGDFDVDETGLITMSQDGAMFAVGQVAIAKFITNRGLEPIGNNLLQATLASGDPIYNLNNDKTAEVKSNTLELSTADLSESLVNLMVFQRAFEANAKSITTADTILNTLIQLKR